MADEVELTKEEYEAVLAARKQKGKANVDDDDKAFRGHVVKELEEIRNLVSQKETKQVRVKLT